MTGKVETLPLLELTHVVGHNAAGQAGRAPAPGAAWTAYTPVVSATGGSLTGQSATGSYFDVGPVRFCDIAITTGTGGSGTLKVTLPSAAAADFNNGMGREIAAAGFMCCGFGFTGNTQMNVLKLIDLTYPGGAGHIINLQICYRTA